MRSIQSSSREIRSTARAELSASQSMPCGRWPPPSRPAAAWAGRTGRRKVRRSTIYERTASRAGRTSGGPRPRRASAGRRTRWPRRTRPAPTANAAHSALSLRSSTACERCSAGIVTPGNGQPMRDAVFRSQRPGLLQQRLQARARPRHVPRRNDGQERQDHQRHGHHCRRFVGMMINVAVAGIAGEGQVPEAEHVERRHARPRQRREEEQPPKTRVGVPERKPLRHDGVLRVEAAQADHRSECRPRRSPGSRRAWCRP